MGVADSTDFCGRLLQMTWRIKTSCSNYTLIHMKL